MASLDGRTLFVDPENPENDLKIISIDPELDRWGGVGFGASLAKTSRTSMRNLLTCITIILVYIYLSIDTNYPPF